MELGSQSRDPVALIFQSIVLMSAVINSGAYEAVHFGLFADESDRVFVQSIDVFRQFVLKRHSR
jgi:hypothetical protein